MQTKSVAWLCGLRREANVAAGCEDKGFVAEAAQSCSSQVPHLGGLLITEACQRIEAGVVEQIDHKLAQPSFRSRP